MNNDIMDPEESVAASTTRRALINSGRVPDRSYYISHKNKKIPLQISQRT